VIVSDPVDIGPVVAVSLKGDDAEAVSAWLTEHKFILPSSDAETLAHYVHSGAYFIAIRRSDSAVRGGPTSVGIHYALQGDHRMLSLGFAKIGAPSNLAMTVFVAAPQAVGPSAPFAALTLDDLSASFLQNGDYTGAVAAAVSTRDSKAFVLEGTTSQSNVASLAPSLAQFIDPNATITRATTIIGRTKLTDDAVFAAPFTKTIPNAREASLSGVRTRTASFGAFALVLVAHALRRRGRRSR
jgi:hypothetical protein